MLDSEAASAAQAESVAHPFSFHGTGPAFFVLVLKNALLTVLTLGLYLPWGRSARRRYLWQNIALAGHRLRYHGTGQELLVGYAKVLVVCLVVVVLPMLIRKIAGDTASAIVRGILAIAALSLMPYAIWACRRYLLSRTSFRGARLRLDGDFEHFSRLLVGGCLLTLVTLGLYGPVFANRVRAFFINGSALGTSHAQYRGDDRVVFRMAVQGLLLSLFSFGLYFFWYRAKLKRYQFASTWFDGAHGELELTGGELLQLFMLRLFSVAFTLGLALPWLRVYTMRFYLARMRLVGPVAF